VTQLRKKVLEELERRNYSQATANAYVAAIRRFAEYFRRSPDQLEREHVRQYQLHLVQERKLEPKCGKSDRSSGSNRGSEVSPDSPGHRNWVGRSYTPADVQELADKTGFELRYKDGAGSQNYWLWLFKR